MQYYKITVYPFDENTYVLYDEKTSSAAVIDPGGGEKQIESFLTEKKLRLKYIILTHAHADHIAALPALVKKYKVPAVLHTKEKKVFCDNTLNLTARFGIDMQNIQDEVRIVEVTDGEKMDLGGKELKFIYTPGHTRGSMCVLADNYLFTGDTLFAGSIGRTDLPTGNYDEMTESLAKLKKMDGDLVILSGHSEETTLSQEIRYNPFLQGM